MYNDNIYFSLYKRVYNDNKYFCYTLKYILLYKTMYNKILLYMKVYIMSYKTMCNKNICCNYILSYIITTNILIIHESVYHAI